MNAQVPSLTLDTQAARRTYPGLFTLWSSRGVSAQAASALALAQCESIDQITSLGRQWFAGRANVGVKTLNEIAQLASWPPETPVDAVAAALGLSIADPKEAREAATDAVIALRRNGFLIAARQPVPAGRR